MPLWRPFKRRRDSSANPMRDPDSAHRARQRSLTDPHQNHSHHDDDAPWSPPRDSTDAAAPAPDIPRHSEKPGRDTHPSRTQLPYSPNIQKLHLDHSENPFLPAQSAIAEKENITPLNNASREDITALPISQPLPSSPHLRPVDLLRSPRIPYNFHQQPSSSRAQTSDGRTSTMRSRKSGPDATSTPSRRLSKRQDAALREEEIRAMSAPMPIPIPKRPGDAPLRRDSKKLRGLATKESHVSLPAPDSVHSSMAAIAEQRGWEVGIMDVFNPRPLVRLSGTPQYVHTGLPPTIPEGKEKQKEPQQQDEKSKDNSKKKRSSSRKSKRRQKIGAAVDDLDASDLRVILERDAKRKEDRERAKQEKLDRKLRRRAESDIRRQRTEDAAMTADERQRAEELRRLRGLMTPPTDVHPALRDHENPFELENPFEPAEPEPQDVEETQHRVGLGIEREGSVTPTGPPQDDRFVTPAASVDFHGSIPPQPPSEWSADADGYHTPLEEPMEYEGSDVQDDTILASGEPLADDTILNIETPLEDDEPFILNTAQAVRLSQTATPPISPVNSRPQYPSTLSRVETAEVADPKPIPATYQPTTSTAVHERKTSDVREKRSSGWTSFFRRSTSRKVEEPPVTGFVNTSRESMRNASLPAHLVDLQSRGQTSFDRRSSGTPARTQSKFREDLPELPISPTDSSSAPSDIAAAAGAAAAARRAKRLRQAEGLPEDAEDGSERSSSALARNDTPVTPRRGPMSLSVGSVGSEGSWLASGSVKRQRESAPVQGPGLLGRNPNFVASYEELGEDKDAEYVHSSRPEPGSEPPSEPTSPIAKSGHIIEQDANTPLTVRKSARRRPTINEAPDIPSSEGIVAEIARTGNLTPDRQSLHRDEPELWGQESPAPQLHSATSVNFGRGHARQISAGSAKVLDIPRRTSVDTAFTRSPISPVSPTTVRYSTLSESFDFPPSRDEPAEPTSQEHQT